MLLDKKDSKFLSLVLRHKPEIIGIKLDENGWIDVDILIQKLNQHGIACDKEKIEHIVKNNDKNRFSFNDTKDKIRASQGHSIDVNLNLVARKPPNILYHGTSQKSVESINLTGLEKRQRHHVHLSQNIETALEVGQRHGNPVIFKILSDLMFIDGYSFYLSDNNVWLTNHVPSKYLLDIQD